MRTNWRGLWLSLAIVLLVVVTFLVGGVAGWVAHGRYQRSPLLWSAPTPTSTPVTSLAQEDAPERVRDQFRVFWQAWSLLENNFYDPARVDYQKMTYGAIKGMMGSVEDDYTFFSTPAETDASRTHLEREYEGIGAYIDKEGDFPVLLGPVHDDTPAARAGLRSGDIVLEVDGVDVEGWQLEEVIALIKGPAGTAVTLKIYRPSEEQTFEVTVIRARIEVPSVEGEVREDGLAYVRLSVFGGATAEELDTVLADLLKENPDGLILDLRGNGGGYLRAAQEVLGRFLAEGVATYEVDRDGSLYPFPVIPGLELVEDLPMVVLVNGGSASASEIVAGALQDTGRAILIGEQTFGKGSIQHVFDLEDGSSIRVTVAHWLTPNRRKIQDEGLTPDIIVPLTPEDFDAGLDPQLDAAAAYLLGQPLPETAATPTPTP